MVIPDGLLESVESPLFPYHAGMFLIVVGILISIVWYIARTAEKKNFAAMLRRLSSMTLRLKDAEHFGHFGSFAWSLDELGNFWSDEMFILFGLVPGQRPPTIEKMISYLFREDQEKARVQWKKAQEVVGEFSITARVTGASGILRYVRFDGKTEFDVNKTPHIQGVAHDITREVEVDRAKSEFVSLASHQLKTPLTAIGWLAEGLLSGDKGNLTPEQKNYVENIHKTDRQMMAMVNDLLNVSRIELGTLQLRPEDIDVIVFAQSVVDEQKVVAIEKHVELKLDFAQDLPRMHVDKNLVKMIFQNLLSNAIKYTPEGGTVTFTITRGGGTKDAIFVTVADTGIGIPKDEQDKVFMKLHRAKNALAQVPDGTGLGLYVVKTIIERVHGAITFDSVEGKGTTFFATLPLVWEDSRKE